MRRSVPSVVLALILLGSCARPNPPEPAPRPAPVRPVPVGAPALPPSADWRDWPITPGIWSFRSDAGGSIALFGTPGSDAIFTLRCDRGANTMSLARAGDARGTGLTIRTSTVTRAVPARPAGATPPYLAAVVSADDRLLDAIGFSRGRFVVEAPPLGALVIPAWPEILRVVEDCRS